MLLGLIGAGSMARGLALGWDRPVLCTDVVAERAQALADEVGGEALASAAEVATGSAHAVAILTWGGLRGGLSVALALSLPVGSDRDTILVMTYVVVAFSILVQGLSFGALLRALGVGER